MRVLLLWLCSVVITLANTTTSEPSNCSVQQVGFGLYKENPQDLSYLGDVVLSPRNSSYLFGTACDDQSFVVMDVSSPSDPKIVATISDPRLQCAWHLAVAANGDFVFVIGLDYLLSSSCTIAAIRVSSPMEPSIVSVVSTPAPWHLALSPDGQYLYAALKFANTLAVYDVSDLTDRGFVLVGEYVDNTHLNGISAVAVSSDATHIFAASDSGSLAALDVAEPDNIRVLAGVLNFSDAEISTWSSSSLALTRDESTLFLLQSGTLRSINVSSRTSMAVLNSVSVRAGFLALSTKDDILYLGSGSTNTISLMYVRSGSGLQFVTQVSEDTFDVPKAIACSEDGQNIYIASSGASGVLVAEVDCSASSFSFTSPSFAATTTIPRTTNATCACTSPCTVVAEDRPWCFASNGEFGTWGFCESCLPQVGYGTVNATLPCTSADNCTAPVSVCLSSGYCAPRSRGLCEFFACGAGDGDCDYDDQCEGDLVCGTGNCIDLAVDADCCEPPTEALDWFVWLAIAATVAVAVVLAAVLGRKRCQTKVSEATQRKRPVTAISHKYRRPSFEELYGALDSILLAGDVLEVTHNTPILDQGGSGRVYVSELRQAVQFHGRLVPAGKAVALKELFSMMMGNAEELVKEVRLLQRVCHPSVVPFFGVFRNLKVDSPAVSSANRYFMVFQFADNGSLRNHLTNPDISFAQRKSWVLDIAGALAYLHHIGIIHRDLKPDNVLVTEDFTCQLSDFGLARRLSRTGDMTRNVGTVAYTAPEVLNGKQDINEVPRDIACAVDTYSFGILIASIFSYKEPYTGLITAAIVAGVVMGTLRPDLPAGLSSVAHQTLTSMWHNDMRCRPSSKTLSVLLSTTIVKRAEEDMPESHTQQDNV